MENKTIGFIGLGIMGRAMSSNLLKKGCMLLVNDLDKQAEENLSRKGAEAATIQDIGARCDIIFMSLPNGEIVQSVLLGKEGVCSSAQPGTLVVDLSSITPKEAKHCAEMLAKKNIDFLDSPVSGGEPKAIDGTLAFMVGGEQRAFDRVMPYLHMMGTSAVLVGPSGSGCVAKLANQVIVNLTIAAVSEAFVLAAKAGADVQKVFEAIRGGLAGSTVLEAKAPMMIQRDFKPGGSLAINMKDIKNVMETAHDMDVPLPLSSQLLEEMHCLRAAGHIKDDHSGIIQYYEHLANIDSICM